MIRVEVMHSEASVATSLRVTMNHDFLLVDAGDGTATRLAAERFDPETCLGVILTHGHPDHVGGLWSVLARLRLVGRRSPLPVGAPDGCREATILARAWSRRYAASEGFALRVCRLQPARPRLLGSMRVTPFAVRHRGSLGDGRRGLLPAVGFSIEGGGRRVVISGDTGPCRTLERAVRGADLALVEATLPRALPSRPDFHLSVAQARSLGRRASAYGLYHLSPESRPLVRAGEDARVFELETSDEP